MTRKAAFGFKVYSTVDELQVSTVEDFEAKRREKEYESRELSKRRKLRWWRRHKDQQNAKRRAAARSVSARYEEAKRKARGKGEGWEFTPEAWELMWANAGWVLVPNSKTTNNPKGMVVPAFALRGSNRYKHTCMQRTDTSGPWSEANCKIMFRDKELNPDNEWFRTKADG